MQEPQVGLDRALEVDGGIHAGTIAQAQEAGATLAVAGTAVYNTEGSIEANLRLLHAACGAPYGAGWPGVPSLLLLLPVLGAELLGLTLAYVWRVGGIVLVRARAGPHPAAGGGRGYRWHHRDGHAGVQFAGGPAISGAIVAAVDLPLGLWM